MIDAPRFCVLVFALALSTVVCLASLRPENPRRVITLDGVWDIEEGAAANVPANFSHKVAVPGLVDLARPAFKEVGRKSPLREAFWYRKVFRLDSGVTPVAILKIHKARFGTRVYLNGSLVGDHLPCFTPAYLPVRQFLRGKGQDNELIIRVGADREAIPKDVPSGWDFEKYLYIPGIYDSVELILTGSAYISNVQVVPDIAAKKAKMVIESQGSVGRRVQAKVVEAKTGRSVGQASGQVGSDGKVELVFNMGNCRLWSPEDPFLYQVTVQTSDDAVKTRFGMRSFSFEPGGKRALLNGRPYYLRGSNFTVYRFFEDSARSDLPWRADWVRGLHRKMKSFQWNALRYCIGFPPEFWYDIADEEGLLIQDEFPIWLLNPKGDDMKPDEFPTAEKIVPQYRDWMRERWNHACVVIWDAQNESFTAETAKAIQAVRGLDLSNRPWDNGWGEPQAETDCVEAHPYMMIRTWYSNKPFEVSEIAAMSGVPDLQEPQKKQKAAIVINEYAWMWLTREGQPTSLTGKIYDHLLGSNSTVEQRRYTWARLLAAKTEFWRAHRECAGVLHFCSLGYSRPGDKPRPEGGATSDHWTNVEKLTLEPNFEKYMAEAFNPVGLMLDFWAPTAGPGEEKQLKVFLIDDLYEDWEGDVSLRITKEGQTISEQSRKTRVAALGREVVSFVQKFPTAKGRYTISAELKDRAGMRVRSLRDFRIE